MRPEVCVYEMFDDGDTLMESNRITKRENFKSCITSA